MLVRSVKSSRLPWQPSIILELRLANFLWHGLGDLTQKSSQLLKAPAWIWKRPSAHPFIYAIVISWILSKINWHLSWNRSWVRRIDIYLLIHCLKAQAQGPALWLLTRQQQSLGNLWIGLQVRAGCILQLWQFILHGTLYRMESSRPKS